MTTHDKLGHYLTRIMNQRPIESNFQKRLPDNLNAEVSLGTVSDVKEAVAWLSYSYMFVRMLKNPLVYGMTPKEAGKDPNLLRHREEMIIAAARLLDDRRMLRFQEQAGYLSSTDVGRIASHYYIGASTIETYNEAFRPHMTEAELVAMVAKSSEFDQIKVGMLPTCVCVCVCACVYVCTERSREAERQRQTETDRDRDRVCDCS